MARRPRYRRNRRHELVILGALVLVLLAAKIFLAAPEQQIRNGIARVIDGDSLVVDHMEIRLRGLDAPEFAQSCSRGGGEWACGKEAARQLRFFVRGAEVTCAGNKFDQHSRLLAVCEVGEREINRWLVSEGWAVSFDDYPAEERKARKEKRGVWSGTFERPQAWRARHRQQ